MIDAPVAAMARIELTDAELREVWARVRRDTWPATFEEAMEDQVLGRLVRMNAQHPPGHAPAQAPAPRPQPAPQAPARPMPHFQPPPGYVDIKRRASGERDDD